MVLLSGGLDSATVLAIARNRGYRCHALSFDYRQRHRVELDAARKIAEHLGAATHRVAHLNLQAVLASDQGYRSALTDNTQMPRDRDESAMSRDIPVTYVPARNTVFLSYALALAETLECSDIFIGANAVDYSGYPDCRPQYLHAFEDLANLATKAAILGRRMTLHAPLIDWPKTRIIQEGLTLGVDYSLTHSCYDPGAGGRACGRCDACLLRLRAFQQLGLTDPLWPSPSEPGSR